MFYYVIIGDNFFMSLRGGCGFWFDCGCIVYFFLVEGCGELGKGNRLMVFIGGEDRVWSLVFMG